MKLPNSAYVGTLVVALLATTCIVGCANQPERPQEQPAARSLAEVRMLSRTVDESPRRPTVALVLGGGGLRGFAHLGVIRALEEAGIRTDIVVGTSAGAVVGAAYASGMSADRIEAVARDVKLSALVDLTLSASGLMRGDHIAAWIDTLTGEVPIGRFPRRFGAVATDLGSGKAVLIDSGRPGVAVQASAAVPGPNVPLAYAQGHLVDGGVSSLVPVRFARAMGADVVIAVDVFCEGPASDGKSVPSSSCRSAGCRAAPSPRRKRLRPTCSSPCRSASQEFQRRTSSGERWPRAMQLHQQRLPRSDSASASRTPR